jgi:hypothetical protein
MAKQYTIIVLNIEIEGIYPLVWRRIAVDGDHSLRMLHHIIQAAFGWTDAHLHEYHIEECTFCMFDNVNVQETLGESDREERDDRKAILKRLLRPGQKFSYLYDFGDSWTHTITVEKIETRSDYWGSATIIDGQRAAPPEDVGGTSGYEDFLEAILHHKRSEKARQYLQWVGGSFDPEAFDQRIANAALLRLAWNGWGQK